MTRPPQYHRVIAYNHAGGVVKTKTIDTTDIREESYNIESLHDELMAYPGAKHAVTSGPYPGRNWDDDQSKEG